MIIEALTSASALQRSETMFSTLASAGSWEEYKTILQSLADDDRAMLQAWLNDGKQLLEDGRTTQFGVALLALSHIRVIGVESLDKAAQVGMLWEALRLDEARKGEGSSPLEQVVKSNPVVNAIAQVKATGAICAFVTAVCLLVMPARAQWIVSDPGVESLTLKKNLEDSLSWAKSLQNDVAQQSNQVSQIANQAQQITQMETQLRRFGDPSALRGILNGGGPRLSTWQPGFSNIKGAVNGASALSDTGNGLYRRITDTSPGGNTVRRDLNSYRQYDMMRQIRQQHEANSESYATQARALQDETKATMAALDSATTEVEIKKYHAKLNALQAEQQVLSDQLNKAAIDSTVQRNDMEANRLMQQKAAAEAYDADAAAAMQANRKAKLPQPVYGALHVE